jgi:hypothetical protein
MTATTQERLAALEAEVADLRGFIKFTAARVRVSFEDGCELGRESILGQDSADRALASLRPSASGRGRS